MSSQNSQGITINKQHQTKSTYQDLDSHQNSIEIKPQTGPVHINLGGNMKRKNSDGASGMFQKLRPRTAVFQRHRVFQ